VIQSNHFFLSERSIFRAGSLRKSDRHDAVRVRVGVDNRDRRKGVDRGNHGCSVDLDRDQERHPASLSIGRDPEDCV